MSSVNPNATQEEIRAVVNDENGGQIFQQAVRRMYTLGTTRLTFWQLMNNRQGESRAAYREVQERHQDLQRIEQTIAELAQLFNDMAILVEEQGEQVKAIEATTQNVQVDTEAGCVLPRYLARAIRLTSLSVASCIQKKRKCRQCRQGRSGGFASSLCSLSSLSSWLSLAFKWPRAILGTLGRRTPPLSLSPLRLLRAALPLRLQALRCCGQAELCPVACRKYPRSRHGILLHTLPPSYNTSARSFWFGLVDHRLY